MLLLYKPYLNFVWYARVGFRYCSHEDCLNGTRPLPYWWFETYFHCSWIICVAIVSNSYGDIIKESDSYLEGRKRGCIHFSSQSVPEVVTVVSIVTAGVLVSFISSAFAVQLDHIINKKFRKAEIGVYFVFATAFYTVSVSIWSCIVQHKLKQNQTMIIGHIEVEVNFFLMGFVPFMQSVLDATAGLQRPPLTILEY